MRSGPVDGVQDGDELPHCRTLNQFKGLRLIRSSRKQLTFRWRQELESITQHLEAEQ